MPTRSTQHGRLTSNAAQIAVDHVKNCPVRSRADGRLEPCAGKLACTVLRGVRAGNGARLPDGKARKPYEFGVKVSITTTHKEGLVIGARSMPGNPYDGHTLAEALEQAAILSDVQPEIAVVDRGYKGVAIDRVKVYHPGLRRGITRGLRATIRGRSAIEPAIGHMKADGKLGRNWLKGALGDAIHAVLCGAGHNLRMILRRLRLFLRPDLVALLGFKSATPSAA